MNGVGGIHLLNVKITVFATFRERFTTGKDNSGDKLKSEKSAEAYPINEKGPG